MRIIAGYARGITLRAPAAGVRPTADRVKESLFSALEPIVGFTVVDLFAGSGALGLEALSRGADAVYWVERDRRTVRQIEANLAKVQAAIKEKDAPARVLTGDATLAHRLLPGIQPDLILADPPYNPERGQKGGADLLLDPDFAAWAGTALLVLEQSSRVELPAAALAHWRVDRQRRYGDTTLHFLYANKGQ